MEMKQKAIRYLPIISKNHLIFYLLWPFGSLIYALKHFKRPFSKTLFWLFCIYFGFVFVYADPFSYGGADSARYAARLIEIHNHPFSFEFLLGTFYNPNNGSVDIYEPLLTWLVGIFTDDPRVLFMLFAAVFGFFLTQNLWIIFQKIDRKISVLLFLFMFSYALINPIWNINGVRMWTAAHVFLFGILQYFILQKPGGISWSVLSVLIHFSFLFPLGILGLWLVVPKKINYLFALYLITAFIDEINVLELRELLSFLPAVFQPRVESYTNEAYVLRVQEASGNFAWHVQFASQALKWVVYGWVTLFFLKSGKWKHQLPQLYNLFLFGLLFGAAAHLAAHVPSGGRFLTISNLIFFAVFAGVTGSKLVSIQHKVISAITVFLLGFSVIFNIRVGLDYIGFLTFIGNPFIAPIFDNQVPIIDFIKKLI